MRLERERLLLPILACLVFLAPFGEGGATPLALLVTQTLVAAGGIAAVWAACRPSSRSAVPSEVVLVSAGLFAMACLASWGSPYPYASFLRCLDYAILLGIFLLALQRSWSDQEKALLADCFLLAASLQAVGILLAKTRGALASFVAGFGLLNTNHEAAYLLAAVLLALPRLSVRGRSGARAARLLAISACLVALVLLMSRGALLGVLAGLAVLLACRWRGLTSRGRLLAAAAAFLFLLAVAAALTSRFQASEDPYRFERLRIWAADLRCFVAHPWLGVGPGIFRHIAQRYNFPLEEIVRFGRNFETPHGDYLGLLVEMGLPGLMMGLLVLGMVFRRLSVQRRSGEAMAEGLLCALAALSAHALVEDLSTRPGLTVTMACLVGVCLSREGRRCSTYTCHNVTALFSGAVLILFWWTAVLNPYLAFAKDRVMRESSTYREMDGNFREAIRLNPYQAPTYRFPIGAFLATRPEVPLSVDLYARFRRDLDEGIRVDRLSADLRLARGRAEIRAFRSLFHDAATRDRALAEYRAAINLAPHDPRIRVEMAVFLREVGRGPEAAEQLKLALEEEPNYLSARLLMTRLLLEQGDRAAALHSWRRAQEIRAAVVNYRPDSGYSADIVRDSASLREALERQLGAS